MARPTDHLPLSLLSLPMARASLRAGAASLVLALSACTGDDGSLDSGNDPGTTAAETGATDPSGDPPASTGTEPATSDVPGTSSGPDPDTGGTEAPGDTTDTATTGDAPTLEEQLEGRWVSEQCEPMPQADGSVLYFGRDFTLGASEWSIVATIYGDGACSVPLLTLDIGGGWTIVGPSASVEGAHEANFDRSSIALTPHVPDFVALFDSQGCGEAPWAVDVQQDVTAEGCAFVPSAEACPVEHDLVALEGEDRLFFGQRPVKGDMCSPRTRPTALGEYAVVRQAG